MDAEKLFSVGMLTIAIAAGFVVMKLNPRLGFALWVASVCFLPTGVGLKLGPFWPATTLVTIALILALLPRSTWKWQLMDGVVGIMSLALASGWIVHSFSTSTVFEVVTQWFFAYALGRIVGAYFDVTWTYSVLTAFFVIVAILALIEFQTGWNPFAPYSSPVWASLQVRGGHLRSEGAFGHSIALGTSLALAVPFAFASAYRTPVKIIAIVLIIAASVTTISRIGIACSLLAALLAVLFLRNRLSVMVRVSLVSALSVAALIATPLLQSIFATAGTEASGSADYRDRLTALVPAMEMFGSSQTFTTDAYGRVAYGGFRSIDSALILTGLRLGVIFVVVVVVLLLIAAVVTLLGKATAPTIAIAAQIPAVATVALITQYSTFIWFVGGLAVTAQQLARRRRTPELDVTRSASSQRRDGPAQRTVMTS